MYGDRHGVNRESGFAALRVQILRSGLRPGVRALVADPVAERARLLEVDATLVCAKCQWLGVIDGATHMNFAGTGFAAKRVKDRVLRTITNFLTGVRRSACELPATEEGLTLSIK
jgi:hypothetical protein